MRKIKRMKKMRKKKIIYLELKVKEKWKKMANVQMKKIQKINKIMKIAKIK